jgi:hypothetical protein
MRIPLATIATRKRRVSMVLSMAAFIVTACSDPLPPQTQWLAGSWQWVSSCCTIAGTGPVADAPDALVVNLHHNGDAVILEHGVETLRTRFDVAIVNRDTLLRFDQTVLYATQFSVRRSANDRLVLFEFPKRCDDCLDTHALVRAP